METVSGKKVQIQDIFGSTEYDTPNVLMDIYHFHDLGIIFRHSRPRNDAEMEFNLLYCLCQPL